MTRRWVIAFFLGYAHLAGAQAGAPRSEEPILPIPVPSALHPGKVALGERLFHEPRLAKNNAMACASCHPVSRGGMDSRARSITNSGEADIVNAPTVFNAVFNSRLTWRGAFRSLEDQAEADLQNPRHANTRWEALLPKLRQDPEYVSAFARIYPNGINRESVLDAIAEYERSLVTPNSRFDRYLRGDDTILTREEKRGFQLFKQYGCVACHQGVNLGGNMFAKLGVFENYFAGRGGPIQNADMGRFLVTQLEIDKHVFRVPGLRNVAVTAPYFHDGSVATLEQAVALMGRSQLGRELSRQDIRLIVRFLHTLTGEYRGQRLDRQP